MTKFRKFIRNVSNLRNAFRVLEIMDYLDGVDIEQVEGNDKYWRIKPKGYLLEEDAKDLQEITLFKQHYKKPPKWFHKLFYPRVRYGYREFYWSEKYWADEGDLA